MLIKEFIRIMNLKLSFHINTSFKNVMIKNLTYLSVQTSFYFFLVMSLCRKHKNTCHHSKCRKTELKYQAAQQLKSKDQSGA